LLSPLFLAKTVGGGKMRLVLRINFIFMKEGNGECEATKEFTSDEECGDVDEEIAIALGPKDFVSFEAFLEDYRGSIERIIESIKIELETYIEGCSVFPRGYSEDQKRRELEQYQTELRKIESGDAEYRAEKLNSFKKETERKLKTLREQEDYIKKEIESKEKLLSDLQNE